MKVKSPKGTNASPGKRLSKKMKVNTPKEKQDRTRSSNPKKESYLKEDKPKKVDTESRVESHNIYVTMKEHNGVCLKDSVSNVIKAARGGRLTASGKMAFMFQDAKVAQDSLKAIKDADFKGDAKFTVEMSNNFQQPCRRLVFIGRDVDVAVYQDVMKKEFKADKAEQLLDRKKKFTGLSILTFADEKSAEAADKIDCNYGGIKRGLKPYMRFRKTFSDITKIQEKNAVTKEIVSEGRKAKLERDTNKKGKKEGLKRKAKVMEEEEEEEDDDDDDEEEEEEDDDDDDDDDSDE